MSFHRNGERDKLTRRELDFQSFDDVLTDAGMLSRVGYHRVGKWSLGQICDHLSRFMNQSLEGFQGVPSYAPLVRPIVRMMYLGKMLRKERLPAGASTLKSLTPGEWEEDASAVQVLQSAINRIQAPDATFQPSPLLGKLTADEWRKIHLWHCQHHLEFLVPAAREA